MKTPKQVAQHVFQLAEAECSMESISFFQQWIYSLQQEAPINVAWFFLTPDLKVCMWLKDNGGAPGQTIVWRTETIPIDLRHLILHGDSATSTTMSSELRSTFAVDSVTTISKYRLSFHDCFASDKSGGTEVKTMVHCEHTHSCQKWHTEVQSDGCLVFRNTKPIWRELVLRGPVRNDNVGGKNMVLGAMPLNNDAMHKWDICVALNSVRRNDPDSIPSQILLKCVGARTTDCFLQVASNAGLKRDNDSFHVFFQECRRFDSDVLPSWRIHQLNVDAARAAAKLYTNRLMQCTTYDADLMNESPGILRSGFYDIVEHAALVVALVRMYTIGAVTVPKLRLASDLLLSAIKLHTFYLGVRLRSDKTPELMTYRSCGPPSSTPS